MIKFLKLIFLIKIIKIFYLLSIIQQMNSIKYQ